MFDAEHPCACGFVKMAACGFGFVGIAVVVVFVVVQQAVVHADEEAAAAAGDVGEFELGDVVGVFACDDFADCVFYDVVHDVFWGVEHAACFAHFGLLFYRGFAVVNGDDVAQKTLVDAAEYVDGDVVEVVGGVGVV